MNAPVRSWIDRPDHSAVKGITMKDRPVIVLDSLDDFTIENAEEISRGRCALAFGQKGRATIERGHLAFQRFLSEKGRYVYGSTTAPGARAKTILTAEAAKRQGASFGRFITMQAGVAGGALPERTVRLALFARLTNALSGSGKISLSTAERVASLLEAPPAVPLQGLTSSGEVMAMSWLLAPLSDMALKPGEAMALVNGSPFSTAMVSDVAITAKRSITVAEHVFALGIEAARAPLDHYRMELGTLWPDPFYRSSLETLNRLLEGSWPERLPHQAPVSWRIVPNILASADRAVAAASEIAAISLRAVKDNPTFLGDGDDRFAVSSGGYHDHQAARSIESVTVCYADLCALIAKQVTRLIDGSGLGLPPLLMKENTDGVGTEYFVWTLTEPLARARHAATSVGLDISLEDPVGNQSDVAQPTFISYARHLEAKAALDQCLAVLATVSCLALRIRRQTVPRRLVPLWERLQTILDEDHGTADAVATPLRDVLDMMTSEAFEAAA